MSWVGSELRTVLGSESVILRTRRKLPHALLLLQLELLLLRSGLLVTLETSLWLLKAGLLLLIALRLEALRLIGLPKATLSQIKI